MLSVVDEAIMLSVIMLSVVMLNVVAPSKDVFLLAVFSLPVAGLEPLTLGRCGYYAAAATTEQA